MEIDPKVIGELRRIAHGVVQLDEPMARHTSFGLGGPADVFVEPGDATAFRECAALLADASVPVLTLGRGTNILVRGGGLDGAVMTGSEAFRELSRTDLGVRAGSGVGLPRLISFCVENGLSGLEGLSGIPGSVGGAVMTNAGSFGVSVSDRLLGIRGSSPGLGPTYVRRQDLAMEYRRTLLPPELVVEEVEFELDADEPERIEERRQATLEKKWKTQPSGMRSAGCIFRNPGNDAAGRLIDSAGLKGTRVGGAVVSDLHANFLLNDRGATADDMEELIEIVREQVADATGITLELEIDVVGRHAH